MNVAETDDAVSVATGSIPSCHLLSADCHDRVHPVTLPVVLVGWICPAGCHSQDLMHVGYLQAAAISCGGH